MSAPHLLKLGVASVLSVGMVMFGFVLSSNAHSDPPDCDSNGVGLSITVLREDGITPVATSGNSVESGETINYRATLSHLGGTTCNFEGGTLTIVTPDGASNVVASGAGIPLVTIGSPFAAPLQAYVVSEGDVNGSDTLPASAVYVDGISHLGPEEQTAGANVNISTAYIDVSLEVSKTAVPRIDTSVTWEIIKTVDIDHHDLMDGEGAVSEYTIELIKTESEEQNYSVTGEIEIFNPATFADAEISDISDVITTGDINADVECELNSEPFAIPGSLPAGETLVCAYSADGLTGDETLNTVTVTTTGDVNGGEATAVIDFSEVDPVVEGFDEVKVEDSFFEELFGPFDESTSFAYEREFMCGQDEGEHLNVATIVETEQSDSALVTVVCTPVVGIEGCTPGYWRQAHHFGNWFDYDPTDSFNDTFDVMVALMWSSKGRPALVDEPILHQALEANGGGLNALARHAVAALLNSTNPDVNYAYTTEQVLEMVKEAIDDQNYSNLHNLLETENERGCPLGRA